MAKFNVADPRNETLLVYINNELLPRKEAKISVLDSLVQGGDGVWEGLRVYQGKVFQLYDHIERMINSAHALAFKNIPTKDEISNAVFKTLKENNIEDGVHIRMTLSRGLKATSGMNPDLNQFGCTLIILPEYKGLVYGDEGLKLVTSSIRRNPPQCLDSKIHHNNLLNNILAKIEANVAEADDAVMLDVDGFISETNATNIFFIKNSKLFTPFATSCLPGLTRQKVLEISEANGIATQEKQVSIAEMYSADECFTTGTMGALAWVKEIDGRIISDGRKGPFTENLSEYYFKAVENEAVPIK